MQLLEQIVTNNEAMEVSIEDAMIESLLETQMTIMMEGGG